MCTKTQIINNIKSTITEIILLIIRYISVLMTPIKLKMTTLQAMTVVSSRAIVLKHRLIWNKNYFRQTRK